MTKQSLTRTSAIIYADSNVSSRKTVTIKKKFVEAVFASNGNKPLTIEEIASLLVSDMDLVFNDSELADIVEDKDSFVLQQVDNRKEHDKYGLTAKRYNFLTQKSTENIDECIKEYLEEIKDEVNDVAHLRSLLETFLYSMMNSNIEAYNQVLGVKKNKEGENKNGRVNPENFSDDEIQFINGFLSWNNSNKDKELFKLVSCCIEYAIVANNTNEQTLLKSLKNKVLYIDNAFVYRAIGINGETRKKRIIALIQKCNANGQKLKITKYSREEFIRTIDHNIQQLNKTTPFGRINPSLFQRYSYGETIYQYYHKWRANRYSYGFSSFKAFLLSEYNSLIRNYGIEEDFHPPFNEKEDNKDIEKYSDEIEAIKMSGHKASHDTDAKNMYWIEKMRNGIDGRLIDTKYYFITPDQKLQLWDSKHSTNQPIALLPSQWLALLLKYTSRSNDDYKSFVSFLRLPHNDTDITAENLQEILSGISEVTEDLQKQSDYLEVYMEEEWNKIRKKNYKEGLREGARRFAKDQQEKRFEQELEQKSKEMAEAIDKEKSLKKEQISAIESSYRQQLIIQERHNQIEIVSLRIDYIKQTLNNIQRQLVDATNRKKQADVEIEKAVKNSKTIMVVVIILLVAFWIILIFHFTWQIMEVYTYALGLLSMAITAIYLIKFEKDFTLKNTINKIRLKKKKKKYILYNISDNIIEEYVHEIDALQAEIKENEDKLKQL